MKKKILSADDRGRSGADVHVVISRDEDAPDPLHAYDQVFLLHSNSRRFAGNENDKGYKEIPLRLKEPEDDWTSKEHYKLPEDVAAFNVQAYIHSGIALRIGDDAFPEDPDGIDTVRHAALMWTDKTRFERLCHRWLHVYDKEAKAIRPAKDADEFTAYLLTVAESELRTFQQYLDGDAVLWRAERRVPYTKCYRDGRQEDGCDWEEVDSCGGFYVDSADDLDFPRGADVDVFDATGRFVGCEYTVHEFVVMRPDNKLFLRALPQDLGGGLKSPAVWSKSLAEAIVFSSWGDASMALQDSDGRDWTAAELQEAVREKDDVA